MSQPTTPATVSERLAAEMHTLWAQWARHMLGVLAPVLEDGLGLHLPGEPMLGGKRTPGMDTAQETFLLWKRQIDTPYTDLSEAEKNPHRALANRVFDLLDRTKAVDLEKVAATLGAEHLSTTELALDRMNLMNRLARAEGLLAERQEWNKGEPPKGTDEVLIAKIRSEGSRYPPHPLVVWRDGNAMNGMYWRGRDFADRWNSDWFWKPVPPPPTEKEK